MNSIICPNCIERHKYESLAVQSAIATLTEAPGTIRIKCQCGTILSIRFFYAPAIMLLEPLPLEPYNPETAIWNT